MSSCNKESSFSFKYAKREKFLLGTTAKQSVMIVVAIIYHVVELFFLNGIADYLTVPN